MNTKRLFCKDMVHIHAHKLQRPEPMFLCDLWVHCRKQIHPSLPLPQNPKRNKPSENSLCTRTYPLVLFYREKKEPDKIFLAIAKTAFILYCCWSWSIVCSQIKLSKYSKWEYRQCSSALVLLGFDPKHHWGVWVHVYRFDMLGQWQCHYIIVRGCRTSHFRSGWI